MTDDAHLLTLQNQLAQMQAQIDALETEKQSWQKEKEKEKEALKEDKVEMQTRIDHLLAELKLSNPQKYGRKSESP